MRGVNEKHSLSNIKYETVLDPSMCLLILKVDRGSAFRIFFRNKLHKLLDLNFFYDTISSRPGNIN